MNWFAAASAVMVGVFSASVLTVMIEAWAARRYSKKKADATAQAIAAKYENQDTSTR